MDFQAPREENKFLATLHPHERDSRVTFVPRGHIYRVFISVPSSNKGEVTSKEYLAVTQWNKTFFKEFNPKAAIVKIQNSRKFQEGHQYWGMTGAEIEKKWEDNRVQASGSGTNLHDRIETFLNLPTSDRPVTHRALLDYDAGQPKLELDSLEWASFKHYVEDYLTMQPYRTEWRIFDDQLQIAGSLDIVYQDPDVENGLILADWKRAKEIKRENHFGERGAHWALLHLHDTNYWKYALQLNTYKAILQRNYGKVVTRMYLVQIHPDLQTERGYVLHEIPDLSKEMECLIQSRIVELGSAK